MPTLTFPCSSNSVPNVNDALRTEIHLRYSLFVPPLSVRETVSAQALSSGYRCLGGLGGTGIPCSPSVTPGSGLGGGDTISTFGALGSGAGICSRCTGIRDIDLEAKGYNGRNGSRRGTSERKALKQ